MFLYHFNHHYHSSSIVVYHDDSIQIGSIYCDDQDNQYIALGTSIHWSHLYNISPAPVLHARFSTISGSNSISQITIQLIHYLVEEYYTYYANIIKLFVPADTTKRLHKLPSKSTNKKKEYFPIIKDGTTLSMSNQLQQGQQCIIMPDRWSTINYLHQRNYQLNECFGSQHSSLQDITWFWNLKSGQSARIICTPAECFWDYHNLTQIVIIDPHKWYYKSQQDPRYDIMRVAELMALHYDCELITNI